MARPPLKIDAKLVEEFAGLGCKTKEIADYFGCCEDTITNRFSAELAKGRSNLRMSLRRTQIEVAKNGNVVMLIWLGKQMLGQVERSQLDIAKIPDEDFLAEAKRRLVDGSEESSSS